VNEELIRLEIFALGSDLPEPPVVAMRALRGRGTSAIPWIVAAIRADALGGVALGRLLEILADLDPERAVAEALRLVSDPRSNVQREAMRTLAFIATPAAIDSLRAIAEGPNRDTAAYAKTLLG
jgi:HEAT repeat protein